MLKNLPRMTLRTALLVPFVMTFLLTIGVIIYVQKQNYQEVVTDLSDRRLSVLSDNVHNRLNGFLRKPFTAVMALAHNVSYHGLTDSQDLESVKTYLLSAFKNLYHSIPQLDVLAFGAENGQFVGFRRNSSNEYSLMQKDQFTNDNLIIYETNYASSNISHTFNSYDPRTRPWYLAAENKQQTVWSDLYISTDSQREISLSVVSPVYAHQQFSGVLVSDLKVKALSDFLHDLKRSTKASFFIMDRTHRLVAQSSAESIVSPGTQFTTKGQRLFVSESNDPIIKLSAQHSRSFDLYHDNHTHSFEFEYNGQRVFNRLTPYRAPNGMTWFIGTSVSETDLLGALLTSQQNSWILGIIIAMVGVLICWFVINRVVRPINTTADAALHLAKGVWTSNIPQTGNVYETAVLVQTFNEMVNNLNASFKALRAQLLYDPLTHLYSRQGLIEISTRQPKFTHGTLFLLGINKFRDINDSVGHYNGDQLLLSITERLKQQFDKNTLLARVGGDEFALFAANIHSDHEVQQFIHQIQQLFEVPFMLEGEQVVANTSIGIVKAQPRDGMPLWLRNASVALNYAKKKTHNGVCNYSPDLTCASKHRTKMKTKIQAGIEQNEFVPYYQPIINLNTGNVCGTEALARWHSNSDTISPLDFIPIAEENGTIKTIGQQILFQACRDIYQSIEKGDCASDFQLHVNVSVQQLSCPEFIPSVKTVLQDTHLSASNLTLEITESRIVDSAATTLTNINTLRDMGISIAIDDFGTGYSSLCYLHSLPFTCLKIDRTFINQLTTENLDRSIVAAVLNITKGLNINVVAEGVETKAQEQLLISLGCHQAQGFYYSRPMPYKEWSTYMVNKK